MTKSNDLCVKNGILAILISYDKYKLIFIRV